MTEAARQAFYDALRDDDPVKLYERAPCGYLSTTPDGTIIKVNETFLMLTGYDRHDLVTRRMFVDLLTPGGRIYHETHYAPLLQMQGRVREIALDLVRADGGRLPVLINSTLERDPDGDAAVIRTAVFDATERREYEKELLRAKQRAEESEARARSLARTLQSTLIPPEPPRIPELDIAAVYRPAGDGEEVGGDFYDVFQIGSDDWVIALGDVCGKGVEAAVVTALVRYTLRAAAVQVGEPRRALATLNRVLLNHGSDRFCTVVLLRLRRSAGTWSACISAGGHPLPLLMAAGAAPTTVGEPGSLVGALDDTAFHDKEVVLSPGSSLVLFTDGVTEGRRDGEQFGDDRLRAAVAVHPSSATSMARGIRDAVLDFQGDRPRDDIAIVAIRVPH